MKKKLGVLAVLIVLTYAAVYVRYSYGDTEDHPTVQRAPVTTGTIVQSVQAIGTLQAVRMVRVGSQVSGTIKAIFADYNTVVKRDQVVAELDPSLMEVQVAVQEANIARQENDIAQQKVQLANDQKNLERAQAQFDKDLVSPQQLENAKLQLKNRMAQIAAAEKMKVQAEAQLTQARLNVSYCTIRSPIDGVVVNRFVDVGQTVQASMNSPQFFMIATDLTTLRLSAGVDEADIGRIRRGMVVTFTVDSYRGQTFSGRVDAVRLNAQSQNSVVTYPVWIVVPNPDLKLRPGMTANLQIVVDAAPDVTRVPKNALKFRATSDIYTWLHALPDPNQSRGVRLPPTEIVPARSNGAAANVPLGQDAKIDDLFAQAPRRISAGQVWVYDERASDPTKKLRQVPVRTGLADAQFIEIVSGDVQAGLEVVTAVLPPPSALQRRTGGIFQPPQRGFGGMTPADPQGPTRLSQPQRGVGRGRG